MCFRPPGAAKAIKCPNCNMFNPPTLEKCRKCGTPIPKNMIPCPECGVPQPDSNTVCSNCGFNGKPGSGDPAKRKKA